MIELFAGLMATFLGILIMERFVEPRSAGKPFLHAVAMLAAMPVVAFYLTLFMISYRPIFSVVFTLIVYAGILVANNAKFRDLKEPLVFSDFALLKQAIQHPALYVSSIGPIKITLVVLCGLLALAGAMFFEMPVIDRKSLNDFLPSAIFLFVEFGLGYLITQGPLKNEFRGILKQFGASTDVRDDIDKLSLTVCLIFYFFLAGEVEEVTERAEKKSQEQRAQRNGNGNGNGTGIVKPRANDGADPSTVLPAALVAVQSESFFDARRLMDPLPEDFLNCYAETCAEAIFAGRLQVPAWGANTLRTEFAFLSGLPDETLGVHRFNPYLKLGRQPVWTLATFLREQGFRTVCIHPFHKTFFSRDKVYPNFGFDEFLDISHFADAPRVGPYVSDEAIADKVQELLLAAGQPIFIFVITMENHGRWEQGRIPLEPEMLAASPANSKQFALYATHLRNADKMIASIKQSLEKTCRDAVLCFFGDHMPSMPELFTKIGYDDPKTDYFIWRKSGGPRVAADVTADEINRLVVDTMATMLAELEPSREAEG